MEDSEENPPAAENLERSRAYSPMATAGLGFASSSVLMMPNGIFASEKGELGEIGSHDFCIVEKARMAYC